MSFVPFMSSFDGCLDSKGRISIPAPFRHVLGAQNTPGVFLMPSFVNEAIEGFGQSLLEKMSEGLADMNPFFSPDHDDEAYAVLSRTQTLPLDENGRIRLPEALIAHARIDKAVKFVGMGRKFEIWNPDAFVAVDAERVAAAKARYERAQAAKTQKAGGAP